MNDPILVRRQLRTILSALPVNRQQVSEEFLVEQLSRFFPSKATVNELRNALEWNQSRGFIDYRHNTDEDRVEWFLTDAGKHKEGL
jgi:hypothetical protein